MSRAAYPYPDIVLSRAEIGSDLYDRLAELDRPSLIGLLEAAVNYVDALLSVPARQEVSELSYCNDGVAKIPPSAMGTNPEPSQASSTTVTPRTANVALPTIPTIPTIPTNSALPSVAAPTQPMPSGSASLALAAITQPSSPEHGFREVARNLHNAKQLGQLGERRIQEILAAEYEVTNVSRQAYSGDLKISRPRKHGPGLLTLMVEVKNYSRVVPSQEVEKFERDVRVTPDIQGAIFISLHSPITGHRGCELTALHFGREIPIIYLFSNDPDAIRTTVGILFTHLDVTTSLAEHLSRFGMDHYPKIWSEANRAMELLRSISTTRVMIQDMRRDLIDRVDRIAGNLLVSEARLTDALDNIRQQVSQALPEQLIPAEELSGRHAWERILEYASNENRELCLISSSANSIRVRQLLEERGLFHRDRIMLRRTRGHLRLDEIELRTFVTKTDVGWIPSHDYEAPVTVPRDMTYDGTRIWIGIGRNGESLAPRRRQSERDEFHVLTLRKDTLPTDELPDTIPDTFPDS